VGFLRLGCVVSNVTGEEVNITRTQSLSMENSQIQQKSKLISIREFDSIVSKIINAETPLHLYLLQVELYNQFVVHQHLL